MKAPTDTDALKLHVSRGKVWYLNGDRDDGTCSGQPVEEFLNSKHVTVDSHVRLVGTASNVRMIMRLYDLQQKGKIASVEVCSPLACQLARHRQNPEAVLFAMRMFNRAPSLGGFHAITEHDYRAYALADAVHRGKHSDKIMTVDAMRLLRGHPAWRPLSFIQSLNRMDVAGVLAYIIDPRWYVNPHSPDGAGKLFEWLGLTPRTQEGVSGTRKPGRYHNRCNAVLRCWKNPRLQEEIRLRFSVVGPRPSKECELPGMAPYDFVWRAWGEALHIGDDGAAPGNPVTADLRASQRFIRFLRLVWLSEIYRDHTTMPDNNAPLFRPTDFFKHQLEIDAFNAHIQRKEII